MELAESEVATSLSIVAGELRVASFQTVSLAVVPRALTIVREQHPGLRVRITHSEPEDALPRLLTRDFDIVLAEEYPDDAAAYPPAVDRELLCTDKMRLAWAGASGEPPRWKIRDLAALRDLPWIMEPPGVRSRRWAVGLCREAGFEPDIRFESADTLLHVRMVEQGLAAALVPDLVWGGQPPTVGLVDLPTARTIRRISTLCRAGTSSKPAIAAFRAALKRAARALRT